MHKDSRLPQTPGEGLLYGVIICSVTVIMMTSLNISLNFTGPGTELFLTILKALPVFFIIAMAVERFIVHPLVEKLVQKFAGKEDSFNAHILFTVFFTVIGMSLIMTVIGDFIGHGFNLNPHIFQRFLENWPRNFGLVLLFELIIAQPLGRFAMTRLHLSQK